MSEREITLESFQLSNIDEMQIEVSVIDERPVVTVDSFYRDPYEVRDAALSRDYLFRRMRYPGPEANLIVPGYPLESFVNKLLRRVHRDSSVRAPVLECAQLGALRELPPEYRYYAVSQRKAPRQGNYTASSDIVTFDALVDLVDFRNRPHFDSLGDTYAAVIYLNPPEQCHGGTAFYRHKATELAHMPASADDRDLERWGCETFTDLVKQVALQSDAEHEPGKPDWYPRWELAHLVEMKFNRLVLYNGALLHGLFLEVGAFGSTLETTRLTQNGFFQIARRPPPLPLLRAHAKPGSGEAAS